MWPQKSYFISNKSYVSILLVFIFYQNRLINECAIKNLAIMPYVTFFDFWGHT